MVTVQFISTNQFKKGSRTKNSNTAKQSQLSSNNPFEFALSKSGISAVFVAP
jgi:hypothetical protein